MTCPIGPCSPLRPRARRRSSIRRESQSMPAHPDLQAAFALALTEDMLPPGATSADPAETARRFAVYRNNVAVSLAAALGTRFPVIRRLVGDDFFAALAGFYARTERPQGPVLHEWGAGFPAFLAAFPPLAAYPYMADVARIELARGRAFHAADAKPIDPADLAMANPDALRLALHPSVALLPLAYPAVSIWQANQPGAAPSGPVPTGPETALVLRDRAFDVPVRTVGPGDAAMLAALADHALLVDAAQAAQMAEPGHDPQPILLYLMQTGTLVPPTEPLT